MSSRNKISLVCLAFSTCMISPGMSQAGTGSCFLKTLPTTGSTALTAVSATYGFTASGLSTGTNITSAPVGNIVRNGTLQLKPSNISPSTTGGDPIINAFAVVTYNQLDVNGLHTINQQYFVTYIDMYTCSFTMTYMGFTGSTLPSESYSGMLVNGGDGMRLMSNNENLFLAYGTSQRL